MSLHEMLADDLRLAPVFEEYLVCKVYFEILEQDHRPETSTLRSAIRTRLKSIGRQISHSAASLYPGLAPDAIDRAADLILERQPVGRDFYLAKLPDRPE